MKKVKEIELFFSTYKNYPAKIILNECEVIKNVPLFIKTHLDVLKANTGKLRYKPYFDRLEQVYNRLKNETQN